MNADLAGYVWVGDGDAAVHDLPVIHFEPENEYEPCRPARQDMVEDGQVNVEEGGDHDYVIADVLHREIQHLDADSASHLREVLSGDLQSLVPVFNEKITAASVAEELGLRTTA